MAATEVKHIVIAGNGATGAVAAAAAAISLRGSDIKITLIQSPDEIATAPVEISHGGTQEFHQLFGIDEPALISKTNGAIGLGTRYRGFRSDEQDAFVPLGSHGMTLRLVDFHHYAAKLRAEGSDEDYNGYSLPATAAATGRFTPPGDAEDPVLKTVAYDIYVDRDRYALYMLERAAELEVTVIDATVGAVDLDSDGAIKALVLADGNRIDGDFFIDCSDNRSSIGHMDTAQEFLDWSSWLPCDRVASVRTKKLMQPELFTSIEAHDNGWLQRTMLGDMTVSSFVYCSQYADDVFARRFLEENVNGAEAGDVRVAERCTGSYAAHWVKNCVAIGPPAVTLEPMEVSSMHLVHSSILRLLAMLPRRKISAMLSEEYNRATSAEVASARDYQILRYALAGRSKGPFWENVGQVQNPDSLQRRIDLFRRHGRFTRGDHEFLSKANWVSSFINFGFWPSSYDPLADMIDEQRMRNEVSRFKKNVQRAAEQ